MLRRGLISLVAPVPGDTARHLIGRGTSSGARQSGTVWNFLRGTAVESPKLSPVGPISPETLRDLSNLRGFVFATFVLWAICPMCRC